MDAMIGDLICNKNTTVAKNTARHVQLYFIADVYFIKFTTVKLVTCFNCTMIKSQVLKIALPGLVTNRAIQRMVQQ